MTRRDGSQESRRYRGKVWCRTCSIYKFCLGYCLSFLRTCAPVGEAPYLWTAGETLGSTTIPHALMPLAGEQHPVIIEPRAHSAWVMNFDLPNGPPIPGSAGIDISNGMHGLLLPGKLAQVQEQDCSHSVLLQPRETARDSRVQDVFVKELDRRALPCRRCDRCNLRRAVRGHFNSRKEWTTLLCKVCLDASGEDVRACTLLINGRCSECTRVAAFGTPHGSNKLVFPSGSNSSITLRSAARHCKRHRADGEVDVKHPRCNWPDHGGSGLGSERLSKPSADGIKGHAAPCQRQPNWGPPGGKPIRCSRHRAASHINPESSRTVLAAAAHSLTFAGQP